MDGAGPQDPITEVELPLGGVSTVEPPDPFVDPPRGSFPKWPLVLGGFLLLAGIFVFIAGRVNLPYYALAPGPAYDVDDFVTVSGEVNNDDGELFFLTVSLDEINALEYITGLFDESVDIRPREQIRPTGVSQDALRLQNLTLMEQSKQDAIFVALSHLGYDVTLEGGGALITEIMDDSAADGVLEANDVIVEINGVPVEFADDVVDLVSGLRVDDELTLTFERPLADGSGVERRSVTVVLGPHIDDPERGMVGVILTNSSVVADYPIDVVIDSQNIGGPSAGLMFTLEIIDLLTEDDLAAGYRIAGTGTINESGEVGPIGGVQQKVFGAIDAGAEYMLVPAGNYDDAIEVSGDAIEVVSIAQLEDALHFFESLS